MEKKKAILYIIIGILLLPILILLSPVLLIIHFKDKRAEEKKRQQAWEKWKTTHEPTRFQTRYTEVLEQQPSEEFIRRVGEFTVLQFISRNDYTGGERKRELIAAEHPEKKAKILDFLKEHPIEELLRAERSEAAHDVDRWELRFIFEDEHLNCTISGYGHTEAAAPHLSEICRHIPPILTDEEKFRMKAEKARLERELQKRTSTQEN